MSEHRTKLEQTIDAAAEAGARKVLHLQWQQSSTNHYRAMEDLLRAYPRYKAMQEHPEDYGFLPVGKSKDISVAPPPGSGARDPIEALADHVDSRAASYDRTMGRFMELDAVVRMFENKPEFRIIRMYYFNEDEHGQSRGDAKPYTFIDIVDALQRIGIDLSERACRYRRTKLVREMTVMLFGIDGAISIESRENTRQMKRGHDDEEE